MGCPNPPTTSKLYRPMASTAAAAALAASSATAPRTPNRQPEMREQRTAPDDERGLSVDAATLLTVLSVILTAIFGFFGLRSCPHPSPSTAKPT